jgi:hypothetical protein
MSGIVGECLLAYAATSKKDGDAIGDIVSGPRSPGSLCRNAKRASSIGQVARMAHEPCHVMLFQLYTLSAL